MAGRVAGILKRTLHARPCVWFLRRVLPFLHLPTHGIAKEIRPHGKRRLKVGDVILTKSPLGIPAMLTRGFDHAAQVIGVEGPLVSIAEMTRKGFSIVSWNQICDAARRVLIVRCDDYDEDYTAAVAQKCLTFRSGVYDLEHELDDGELNCAELPVKSDFEGRMNITFGTAWTGQRYVTPQRILDAKNVSVVWDSDGRLKGQVKR